MIVFRQFMKLTLTELRLFRREPEALFFTFIFPVFFLFLTMEVFIAGDVPGEIVINYIVPSLMVLVIAGTAINSVPQTIVHYRKIKFLKRLKGSPVASITILGSLALADFIVTVLGVVLLIIVAVLVYSASLVGSFTSFLAGFALTFVSLAAIFLFIPAIARSPRSAGAMGMFIYFPVMFFSGVLIPVDMLPDWIVRYISPYLPVTHAVELMQGLWLGISLLDLIREVFILLGILCLGLIIAVRTFRWE